MAQKTELDISNLSLDDLKTLRPKIDERIAELEAKKREEILTKMQKLAESIGETPESLVKKERKRQRQAEKGKTEDGAGYRHPETGETWSGRGRKPKWVTEHLESGGKLEDLAATAAAA